VRSSHRGQVSASMSGSERGASCSASQPVALNTFERLQDCLADLHLILLNQIRAGDAALSVLLQTGNNPLNPQRLVRSAQVDIFCQEGSISLEGGFYLHKLILLQAGECADSTTENGLRIGDDPHRAGYTGHLEVKRISRAGGKIDHLSNHIHKLQARG